MHKVDLTQTQWDRILDTYYSNDGCNYIEIGPWLRDRYHCVRVERVIEVEKVTLFFDTSRSALLFALKHA